MRVNVTYSVELEEIKQIIQEILLKVEDNERACHCWIIPFLIVKIF